MNKRKAKKHAMLMAFHSLRFGVALEETDLFEHGEEDSERVWEAVEELLLELCRRGGGREQYDQALREAENRWFGEGDGG